MGTQKAGQGHLVDLVTASTLTVQDKDGPLNDFVPQPLVKIPFVGTPGC